MGPEAQPGPWLGPPEQSGEQVGLGQPPSSQHVTAWENTEAAFAALCGVSPVDHSSGRRSSPRLNHGDDRQAKARPRRRHTPRARLLRLKGRLRRDRRAPARRPYPALVRCSR
ncbi:MULTISPECIES: transposase [Streptomyces]|uniref:transposase n=1 Tax=Streptomyces TaxID=1883 RepID=UPI002795C1E8|nr:transposase [Streptomyces canarius]